HQSGRAAPDGPTRRVLGAGGRRVWRAVSPAAGSHIGGSHTPSSPRSKDTLAQALTKTQAHSSTSGTSGTLAGRSGPPPRPWDGMGGGDAQQLRAGGEQPRGESDHRADGKRRRAQRAE